MQFTWAQFNKTVASVPPNQNRKLGSLPLGALKPLYLQNGLIRPFSAYIYVRDAQPAVPIVGDAAPVAFNANMIIVIILYTIALFAGCFTLYIKYKGDNLWFFKSRNMSEGSMPLWLPNTTVLFTVWSLCYTSLAIPYIALLIAAQKRKATASASQTFMVLIWLPMLYSLWTEFWGMAGALATSSPSRRVLGVKLTPGMINTVALFNFIIVPPALVPDFAYAARSTIRMEKGYGELNAWLSKQATLWNSSSAFVFDDKLFSIGNRIIKSQRDFARFLSHGFIIFMALTIYAVFFSTPIAIAYLKLLRNQLSTAIPGSNGSLGSARSDRFETLQMSYHMMVVECILVVLAAAIYVALTAWAGLCTVNFLADGVNAVIQHCLFYHTYSLLGVPLCCLITFRSWKTYRDDRYVGQRASAKDKMQRSVIYSTEVQISVEAECHKEKAFALSTPSLDVEIEGPFNQIRPA